MRSRPESCGKDSHETPCSIDGECLCCFSLEWLLCAAVEPVRVWMRRRLCSSRRMRSWRMSSGHWLQPGSWHNSNRFPSTGTSRHFTIHTAAGGLPTDDAADDGDGLSADVSLKKIGSSLRGNTSSETRSAAGRYVISCRLFCCAHVSFRDLQTESETCKSERCFNQTAEVSRWETFDLAPLFCETSFVS